jgi:hypothetical protein
MPLTIKTNDNAESHDVDTNQLCDEQNNGRNQHGQHKTHLDRHTCRSSIGQTRAAAGRCTGYHYILFGPACRMAFGTFAPCR